MTDLGFRLRHLAFHGFEKKSAIVEFYSGLNVVYGASDTGKSFIVEAIDFMFGGKPPLRDLPERVGYDRISLGVESVDGQSFTLLRSTDGGGARLYDGLHRDLPVEDAPFRDLGEQHSEKNPNNISTFFLELCGLSGKRVRKNARGDTNSLSFRNVARLITVTETEIVQQRTPLSDGNVVSNTSNFSTFKLLLTGSDDSALISAAPKGPEEQSRDAQLDLLDQLLGEYRDRLAELTDSPRELNEQLEKIDTSIELHSLQLRTTEGEFRTLSERRRDLRRRVEEARDRMDEVGTLLERFDLLDKHYSSDMERLGSIEEGGTLFRAFGPSACPLCGAAPEHHRLEADCGGNIEAIVSAARRELAKIEILRSELQVAVADLRKEKISLAKRLPTSDADLRNVSSQIDDLISPKLSKLRSSYAQFADKRGEVREALSLFRTVDDIEKRRANLAQLQEGQSTSSVADGDLPISAAIGFAEIIEGILNDWHFPETGRVYFDAKARDIVIGTKLRSARGKGLRAVSHSAFTIGLLEYCKRKATSHPGLVILDSPLLAYREPDGTEEDLSGTDLKEKFYSYLAALPADRQVIIIENTDPPEAIKARKESQMFSKNPHSGRYGLFPHHTAGGRQ